MFRLRQLLLLLCIFAFSLSVNASKPAPKLLQLKAGMITYGGSDEWSNSAMRDEMARRAYFWLGGASDSAAHEAIYDINPSAWIARYEVFLPFVLDTPRFKAWGDSVATLTGDTMYMWRNLTFRTKTGAADSVVVRPFPFFSTTEFEDLSNNPGVIGTAFSWYATTPPGSVHQFVGFAKSASELDPNELVFASYIASGSGVVDSLQIGGNPWPYDGNSAISVYPPVNSWDTVWVGIYTNSGTSPSTLIDSSTNLIEIGPKGDQWCYKWAKFNGDALSTSLSSGTTYWIAVQNRSNTSARIEGAYVRSTTGGFTTDPNGLVRRAFAQMSLPLGSTVSGITLNEAGDPSRLLARGVRGAAYSGGTCILGSIYPGSQYRFSWNWFNWRVGAALWWWYDLNMKKYANNAIFMDEDIPTGFTNGPGGIKPPFFPFKKSDGTNGTNRTPETETWLHGSPYLNIKNDPFGTASGWDYQTSGEYKGDANTTAEWGDILDSLRSARQGWQKCLSDSAFKYNKQIWSNMAGVPVNTSGAQGWPDEGRLVTKLGRGMVQGEFSYINPSYQDNRANVEAVIQTCLQIKDYPGRQVIGWIEVDPTLTPDLSRQKMNMLGFMLECNYPGSMEYLFMAETQTGNVTHEAADSAYTYLPAWGKYFGIPNTTRTVTSGTDPVGQGYNLRRLTLTRPNSSEALTFAVGRYTNGANYDTITTAVTFTVPSPPAGKSWSLLKADGGWTPLVGTTVNVGNGHWIVMSSDPTLADAGISDVPGAISILVDSILSDIPGHGDADSVMITVVTPDVPQNDFLIIDTSTVGFAPPSLDSTASHRIIMAWPNNTTTVIRTRATISETGNLYAAAWGQDTSVYSTRVQASDVFTYVPPPDTAFIIQSTSSSAEGSVVSPQQMRFIVTVTGAPLGVQGNKTYRVSTSNGTAIGGVDYVILPGITRTIESTHTADTFYVDLLGNSAQQPNRTFNVTIDNPLPSSATLVIGSPSVSVGTINDDDLPPRKFKVRKHF